MNDKTTSRNKLLILVDGSSYMYRAYHAMPQFTNSRGDPIKQKWMFFWNSFAFSMIQQMLAI